MGGRRGLSTIGRVPVPPYDPRSPQRVPRWLAGPLTRFGRSRAGRWVGIHLLSRVDPWLLRVTRGRLGLFPLRPTLLLTVPGRRTGEPRSVPLLYFTVGAEVVVIASSFGRPHHPAWYHNVRAHPEVTLTVAGRSHRYLAREVTGEERDELYALARELYAGYGDYELLAGEAGRAIPVLALRPRG